MPGDQLFGRQAELAAVHWLLDAAANEPAGLSIEGEPGIGKSAIIEAAVAEATKRTFRVLFCRGAPAEARYGYAGLADLLESVPELSSPDFPLSEPQRHALAVAMLEVDATGPVDAAMVANATSTVLRQLASERPLLLAIDDLSWLDASTLTALAFAVRRLDGCPVAVLIARRLDAPNPTVWDLHKLVDTFRQVEVGPLRPEELHETLRAGLGVHLGRPALRRIHAATGGNPLYAIELVRALGPNAASIGSDPLPVPGSLVEIVADRLSKVGAGAHLEDTGLPMLYAVAAAARPTLGRLRDVLGDSVQDRLEAAQEAGVVRIVEDRIEFAHPLLASVVLDQTPPVQRREIHSRLAAVETEPEARARHLALATLGSSAEVAEALETAAKQVVERGGAAANAAELLRLSLARTPDAEEPARLRRSHALAVALYEAGDLSGSAAELEALIPRLPDGTEKARALLRSGTIAWLQEPSDTARSRTTEALRYANGDDALLGQIHGRLAVFLNTDRHRSAEHAAKAVEALERTDANELYAAALCNLFHTEVLLGREPRVELLERALELESPLGSPDQSTVPGIWYLALDQWDKARDRYATMIARDRARGDLSSEAGMLHRLAEVELVSDDWPAALRRADEARAAARLSGSGSVDTAAAIRAQVLAHTGDHAAARSASLAGVDRAQAKGNGIAVITWLSVLASIAAAEGDSAEVVSLTGRAMEQYRQIGTIEPLTRLDPSQERASALVEVGALDEAEELLASMEVRHRRIPRPFLASAIARGRGLLLAARGDLDGALAASEIVLTEGRSWRPYDRARTLLERGRLQRRARRTGAAAESLEEASSIFTSLGALVWASVAQAELERLGRRRSVGRELTPTERRVAELIATGRTNREVATELYMSPRTVEAHVTHIYRKLGVRTRAELGRVFS
jgi:DNA-binding CsgD family transcriptional regulator